MPSVLAVINRLLPFATPGTPLLQDLAHLAAICLLLYYAPRIQDWSRARRKPTSETINTRVEPEAAIHENAAEAAEHEVNDGSESQINRDIFQSEEADPPHAQEPEGHAAVVEDGNDGEDGDDTDEAEAGVTAGNGVVDRNVGAKKAKSLARKDQRRAYNEFMRSQGDAQRARDAQGAAEREAVLEAERNRRALAEAELAARKAEKREQKREAEQAERQAEYQRRETAIAIVKADLLARNLSDLHKVARQVGGDVDEEWVEKVVHASGIVGRKDDALTMITTTGWAARISEHDARAFYDQIANAEISNEHGHMDDGKVSETLVSVLTTEPIATSA